jgi:hypothetical protein
MNKLLVIFTCLLLAIPCQAKIIYVDDDANGLNNGSSWQNAYRFLQDALADANASDKPVEICVAEGFYKPDRRSSEPNGNGDRTATFQLINGVILKGGYAGFSQPDPNARNIELYETILNGDLDGNDIEVSDPCDLLTEPTRDENSFHVVTGTGTNETTIIDGFAITAGNANGQGRPVCTNCGGGMYNYMGNPFVANCTFISNSAETGGGMQNRESSPTLSNCIIINNAATDGGGISNWWQSNPILRNCVFIRNSATRNNGGGMCNVPPDSNPTLKNCIFLLNQAKVYGGAVCCLKSFATLKNCLFIENDAESGGGVYSGSSASPIISQCTFHGNKASYGGGMYLGWGTVIPAVVTNSIIWKNAPDEIHRESIMPSITYTDIRGGWHGEGNIDKDPCFSDPNNGDYHLKSQAGRWDPPMAGWIKDDVTSPCIDAGEPASPIGLEPFPNGGIINMGAYGGTAEASKSYFGEPVCETIVAGDINGDCIVNLKDFALMALHWLEEHR